MKILRLVCSVLLGLPLLIFGANYFLHLFPLPADPSPGGQLLQAMRDGGLMSFVAFSHVVAAVLILVPRTRFLGGLLQLPMTLGIASFHLSMSHAGIPMAAILLFLNLGVVFDRSRLIALVEKSKP
jgi:hypothetical protein